MADWARLSDPGLQALLQQAEAANRDLAKSALRLRQAGLQVRTGELRLTSSAGADAGASRALDPPNAAAGGTSRSVSASLGASYELDLWGRIAALQGADQAQLAAARSDLRAARLLLRHRVAEAYWRLAAARQQTPLAEEQLALSRQLLAATRLRVQEGVLLPIEIDRAAASLQQAELRGVELQTDSAQQRLQLALLLDQPPPGPALNDPRLPSVAATDPRQPATAGEGPPPWRIAGDPASVLERRPDVQRARAQVDAALARLRAAERQRYPTLSFSASLGTGGSAVSDWLSNPVASLAGSLVVPLVDWRRLDLQRDGARTELDLAALALREIVARALVEIESAVIDGQGLQRQLEANAARWREAQAAERLAQRRFEAGAIARADAVQARIARLDAEQARLQLQLRAWLQRSQLAQVLALE
jgi:outer membrane protein TolC